MRIVFDYRLWVARAEHNTRRSTLIFLLDSINPLVQALILVVRRKRKPVRRRKYSCDESLLLQLSVLIHAKCFSQPVRTLSLVHRLPVHVREPAYQIDLLIVDVAELSSGIPLPHAFHSSVIHLPL